MTLPTAEQISDAYDDHKDCEWDARVDGARDAFRAVAKELRKMLKTNTNEMGETELEVEISNFIVQLEGEVTR